MGKRKQEAQQMSVMELLAQDRWWKTRDGELIKLDQMSVEHRLNLLALLRRQAPGILRHQVADLWQFASGLRGEMALDAAEQMIHQAFEASDDPIFWLEEQPLYQELKRLVAVDLDLYSV